MHLDDLPTPCAVVDLDRIERNVERFSAKAQRFGVRLRPHVKTHKCIEASRLQVAGHFGGITVSTLAEARFFAGAGFKDIVYAVPIAPGRFEAAINISETIERFMILVDHPDVIESANQAAKAKGTRLRVMMEVDCGGGRSGVHPDDDNAIDLARRIDASPNLELHGLLTHAGHAYSCLTWAEVQRTAEQERSTITGFADRIRKDGIDPGIVSVGSTPTFAATQELTGVDEVRPGNYIFFDTFQTALGSCRIEEVAFSIMATVIGIYPQRNELVVDAGALALSKDPGPTHLDPDCGFGIVVHTNGIPCRGLRIVSLTQEHGLIRADGPNQLAGLTPGSRLRILPNHSCIAAALHDRYYVVRGDCVVDQWRPVRGW